MGNALNGPLLTGSISAIVVIEDDLPDLHVMNALSDAMAPGFVDSEIVIVANAVSNESTLAIKRLLDDIPDVTVHFLPQRVDTASAQIVGLENAVGDWLLLLTPTQAEVDALADFLPETCGEFDLIVAQTQSDGFPLSSVYAWLEGVFFLLYNRVNRTDLQPGASTMRLLRRPVAHYILRQSHAEALLKARQIGGGFPAKVIPALYPQPPALKRRGVWDAFARALHWTISTNALPIRLVSLVGVASGIAALVYAAYVVMIYLLKPDVEAGWTTLSLQLSGISFLFSIMFALLAEYIIQIHAGTIARRKIVISHELRSPLRRRGERLNVVDAEGRFHLGKPRQLQPDT